jgi:hypothetical protein
MLDRLGRDRAAPRAHNSDVPVLEVDALSSAFSAIHANGRAIHASSHHSHPNTLARSHRLDGALARPPTELCRQELAPDRLSAVYKPGLHRLAVGLRTPVGAAALRTPRQVAANQRRQPMRRPLKIPKRPLRERELYLFQSSACSCSPEVSPPYI